MCEVRTDSEGGLVEKNNEPEVPAWFLGSAILLGWLVSLAFAFWMGEVMASPQYTSACDGYEQGPN